MSLDAFEIRIRFVDVVRRLTSSQQSIQKLVVYAIKHGPRCSNDLWDCLVEEIEKANINARINIFYALDSLMEASTQTGNTDYLALLKRDLAKIVACVVPYSREGLLNLMSAKQILGSWRIRRVIEPELIDKVNAEVLVRPSNESIGNDNDAGNAKAEGFTSFSRNDILRRIEDDRERHKRLRERIWVLPQPSAQHHSSRPATYSILATVGTAQSPASPASPAAPNGNSTTVIANLESDNQVTQSNTLDPVDIEFEQVWESQDALAPDDLQIMKQETERCFGPITNATTMQANE